MTIPVGPMGLEQPQPPDDLESYFIGTSPSGGYWTILSRLSAHDHSGGLLGNPVAVTIPDGSITTADLDASVLAPYAPTDGSKPFTGEVTLQADAVVRDALRFGVQGSAAAPDASLARTGPDALRVEAHLGVGVAPHSGWGGGFRALQVGDRGAVAASIGGILRLSENSYTDGTTARAIVAGAASYLDQSGGALVFANAPAAGAGAAQAFTTRLTLGTTGTLTLEPDAAAHALVVLGSHRISSGSAALPLVLDGWQVVPTGDGAIPLGEPAHRWNALYASNGTIQTSDPDQKTAVVPVDPEAALADVLAAQVIAYELPAPDEDDPGATMRHVGFDASTAPERLRVGRRAGPSRGARTSRAPVETSLEVEPNTTASMALAAIQALTARLDGVTARVDALEGAA